MKTNTADWNHSIKFHSHPAGVLRSFPACFHSGDFTRNAACRELHWLGIDEDGIRRKDIALCELKRSTCFPDTSLVRTEPEKLYGYLRDDGSWLIPPVYDEIRENLHGLAIGTRRIRGEKVLFRISEDGTPQMTTLPDFVGNFRNG